MIVKMVMMVVVILVMLLMLLIMMMTVMMNVVIIKDDNGDNDIYVVVVNATTSSSMHSPKLRFSLKNLSALRKMDARSMCLMVGNGRMVYPSDVCRRLWSSSRQWPSNPATLSFLISRYSFGSDEWMIDEMQWWSWMMSMMSMMMMSMMMWWWVWWCDDEYDEYDDSDDDDSIALSPHANSQPITWELALEASTIYWCDDHVQWLPMICLTSPSMMTRPRQWSQLVLVAGAKDPCDHIRAVHVVAVGHWDPLTLRLVAHSA